MKGQWLHTPDGSAAGYDAIINVDERRRHYEGAAYICGIPNQTPTLAAFFRTRDKDHRFSFRTGMILPIQPETGLTTSWDKLEDRYPEVPTIPEWAEVSGQCEGEEMRLSWTTNLGAQNSGVFHLNSSTAPSQLVSEKKNWSAFRDFVAPLEPRKFIFRGQSKPLRLRTSFHRSGRADANRFAAQDLPALHRHLSARTRHVFNLLNPDENGAFLNLAQHHGYPTPLLDWTFSPYVAAFFAYRNISEQEIAESEPEAIVRVLMFDQAEWTETMRQFLVLAPAVLHVSVREFPAIENERLVPQQGVSIITNVDNIEAYIQSVEKRTNRSYLTAIDLPLRERNAVMRELTYMGITAGALFPGLDGACEELRDRNFELY